MNKYNTNINYCNLILLDDSCFQILSWNSVDKTKLLLTNSTGDWTEFGHFLKVITEVSQRWVVKDKIGSCSAMIG